MTDTNQGTLRDYVRVLRDSRWVIIAVTVLFAAIAAGNSLSQKPRYDAAARVSFQEESRSNAEAGLAAVQSQTAAQLAAEGASTMLSNDVLQRVRGRLRTPNTIDQLRGMLTTSVDASSALVAVQATSGDKKFAAALANEVANGAVTLQKTAERKRFAVSADRIERQYETLRARGTQGTRADIALASLLGRLSTLRTLSFNAAPARLAEAASVPSSASSPKPLRSTVFAGLIGLLLSVGFAFVRRSLDHRLRDSKDIREALHLPVVGSVRIEALGGAACVSNGRGPMADEDVESFRILRTNIEFLDVEHPIKSILVTSPLPEEGKTTVAASLAAANALAGKHTLLVECDLRRPRLADRLSVKHSPGLSDYLAGKAQRAAIMQLVTLVEPVVAQNGSADEPPPTAVAEAGKLTVVTAGSRSIRPSELLGSQRFKTFLEEVSSDHDAIVIDTPPLLSVSDTLEIVPLADAVLLCIRAEQTTRDQATAVSGTLAHLPERTTAVVITGLKPGRESDYGYYSHAYYDDDR